MSIDPRRVYVKSPNDIKFKAVKVTKPGTFSILIVIKFTLTVSFHRSIFIRSSFECILLTLVLVLGPLGEEYAWYQCTVSTSFLIGHYTLNLTCISSNLT